MRLQCQLKGEKAHALRRTIIGMKGFSMARKKQELVIAGERVLSEPQRELRKANEAIGLRVAEGRLSLLNRKLLNVLMYHAQGAKVPGENAPVDTPANRKYFWVPLSDLAKDAKYDSNDTAFLKQQLLEMQDIKLLLENDREWASERLIASIKFANPKGLKSGTGQVWVGFAFPPEVYESVMAPASYTKLSIIYQGVLRSGSALALYEICRRYATNPSKVTSMEPVEYWYGALTGNPVQSGDELQPYKYFKRDVIKPAMAEVNTLTDIEVELIEHKNGRRVERLQFRVEFAKQPQLSFGARQPAVIDMDLLGQIMELGFNQSAAADIVAMHDDEKIRKSLAFVRARMNDTKMAQLDAPAGYFTWVLQSGGAAVAAHQSKITRKKSGKEAGVSGRPDVMEMFNAARVKNALEVYKEMDPTARHQVYERFVQQEQSGTKIASYDRLLDHGISRTLLATWYAQDLWGDPTVEDMVRFVQNMAIESPSQAMVRELEQTKQALASATARR